MMMMMMNDYDSKNKARFTIVMPTATRTSNLS